MSKTDWTSEYEKDERARQLKHENLWLNRGAIALGVSLVLGALGAYTDPGRKIVSNISRKVAEFVEVKSQNTPADDVARIESEQAWERYGKRF